MKSHFDVLSKKPREEWVTVLVEENSEESEVVSLRFREIPEAELSVLEASFGGAVAAVGKFAREIGKAELKLHEERAKDGAGQLKTLDECKKLISGYREAKEDLQALRREIVGKSVIDHKPEYFELDHLPFEGDDLAADAKVTLLSLGFSEEAIAQAFKDGFIRLPFTASTWVYGEGLQAKTLPCAHADTIRAYERLRPNAQLLNSLCTAVFYWHRLALKPATQQLEALKEARLKRTRQGDKVKVFLANGYIKPTRIAALVSLSTETFSLVSDLLLETVELQLSRAKAMPPRETQPPDPTLG